MAKFRGIVQGDERTEVTRLGHKRIHVEAQSWEGKVVTEMYESDAGVQVCVRLEPHHGHGISNVLYYGPVDPEKES